VDSVADLWPVFGLFIQTPRLRLRLPREEELGELVAAARAIARAGEPELHLPWMYGSSPGMERQFLQRYWRALAHWKPESWHLPLAIYLDGRPIGVQDLWANDFARVRSVGTASWITRGEQGHGYGTEARAAVLELAFGQLGAAEACTEYLEGNYGSEKVSRKLGYTDNGQHRVYRDDTGGTTEYRLRLDRHDLADNDCSRVLRSVPVTGNNTPPGALSQMGRLSRIRARNRLARVLPSYSTFSARMFDCGRSIWRCGRRRMSCRT
jgi:RimJ/RimL family protein N-acetyltransferase